MKRKYLFLLLIVLSNSCGKIELPQQNEKPNDEDKPTPTPPLTEDTLSVADVLSYPLEEFVTIKGYMVGYVAGTSLKAGAKFDIPKESQNTNFLLADHPNEDKPTNCIAVKLEKSGKYPFRNELNLYDNPEFLKQKIAIDGWTDKYFGKNGITRIFSYIILKNDKIENQENNDDTEDGEENSENEENNNNNDNSQTDSIAIDNNEQLVPDGRIFKKNVFFSEKSLEL